MGAFPIGIETEAFAKAAQDAARHPLVRRMCESLRNRKLIIGVDRLDYSKGIPQRIEAFHCFVESNPGARDRVSYLQITPKSRSEVPEYAQMQREIAEQIGRTNGDYGDLAFTSDGADVGEELHLIEIHLDVVNVGNRVEKDRLCLGRQRQDAGGLRIGKVSHTMASKVGVGQRGISPLQHL